MNFGERVRKLREKASLKQLDLANAMQVSPQAVSKWERGENYPDIVLFLKLAKILGVTTDYLLGVTEEQTGIFEATILSTGIRKFAEKSKTLSSKEVADWANVVFHHLTESVLRFDGVPIKYVGDGFLCFFSGSYHADRALKAAIHAKKIVQNDDLVITLNSGDIYLGTIGHPDYSMRDVIGDTVNISFLMLPWVEKHCASGVGITENVQQRLSEPFNVSDKGKTFIKLAQKKINMFEVTDKAGKRKA